MTNLDWRDPKNYEYTKKLNTKGWAWEFIRRSASYKNAYAQMKGAKKDRVPHPPKKNGESDKVWMARLADGGEVGRHLTPAQIRAQEWGLRDMYDPDIRYNDTEHLFDLNAPFPAFYGQRRDVEDIGNEKSRKRIAALFQENPMLLAGLQPLDNINELPETADSDGVILIAFDTNSPLSRQIAKAKVFLENYQKIFAAPFKAGREQRPKWTRYIRMLDAAVDPKDTSLGEKIKIIDPSRKGGLYNEVNGYAHDTLVAAREMAEEGYKKLLFTLSAT